MATNNSGDVYKSSGGFIPGEGQNTWYGVPKEYYDKNIQTENTKFINYNKGTSQVNNPSVVLDAETNSWKLSNENPIYTCFSFGWGEVYGGTDGQFADYLNNLSPETNPTTTAARRALTHSLMSILASSDFYMFMLIKGYIYKSVPEYVNEPPKVWIDAIAKDVIDRFDIPSYPEQTEKLVIEDKKIINAFGKEDTVPEGKYYYKDVLVPNKHPSYGTNYDPSSNLDPAEQSNSSHQILLGGTADEELFEPQNLPSQKPSYVSVWSALWKKDDIHDTPPVDAPLDSVLAPVYESKVEVDGEAFLGFLEAIGLVEFNTSECIDRLQAMLNPTPEFDKTTGQTLQGGIGINIPGAAGKTNVGLPENEVVIPNEDLKLFENINSTLQVPESPKFSIGTIHPGATHFVNNEVFSTLTNQSIDSEIKTSYAKYQQDGKIRILLSPSYAKDDNTATTLEYGSTIKVLDEYTTFTEGKFHRVQIIDPSNALYESKQPLYIKSELLSKLPETLPSLNRIFKKYSKSTTKVEWQKMEDEEIFFDKHYLAYSVVVEPVDPATNKKITSLSDDKCSVKVEDLESQVIRTGIEVLMNCYNKSYFVDQDKDKTLDYLTSGVFQFAYSKDGTSPNWYLDSRPNSKLRMIVRIPAKYFDALSEKVEDFDGIPILGTQGISNYRVTTLLTCNISHKIKMATSIMKKYQAQIEEWDGVVEGLDFELEIDRLNAFAPVMEKFVKQNGYDYDPDGEDELEIGCDNKFNIQYVNYVRAGLAKPLRFCFNRFRVSEPVKHPRTMAYIYYLDQIVELERRLITTSSEFNQINWVQFVQNYTYPVPKIRPSSRKKESPLAPNYLTDGKEDKAKKLQLKFDKDVELTSLGKISLDKELSFPDLKLDIANSRLNQIDFVGDLFVGSIPNIIDLIRGLPTNFNGLQDLFSLVFDKIDIGTLSSLSAGSLASDMTNFDIQNAFSLAALDSIELGSVELGKITGFLPNITLGKLDLAEGYLNGTVDFKDLEGQFPEDVVEKIIDLFGNITFQGKEEPQDRDADLLKNASIEDIKCLGLDKKYGSNESPKLSKSENNRKELIKLIASPQEIVEAVQKAIPQVFDTLSDIGDLGSQDLPSLSLTKNAAVKMPKPPTFSLPKLKIDDTMPGIAQDLNKGIEEIIATILIELTAALLESVFNSVFSQASKLGSIGTDSIEIEYGGQQIGDLIEDYVPTSAPIINQYFSEIGIEYSENDKTPEQVIADVSEILTPFEVLDLLEGTPNKETLQVVEAIIAEENKKLADSIREKSSVKQVFKALGGLVDPVRLQDIRNLSEEILPNASGLLCEQEVFSNTPLSPGDVVRKAALEDKLDQDCIDAQLKEIREQRTKNLANLLSLSNGKDVLAGKIPSPIDNCGPNAKQSSESLAFPTSGIINKNHQTIDYLNNKVIKAVFDPIKMNFSTEANSISDVYVEQERKAVTPYDEQYDALKPTLQNAGLSGDDNEIEDGFAGNLGNEKQPKFETAVAPLLTYSKEVAPKIRKTYGSKIAKPVSIGYLGRNKNIEFKVTAEKYEESPQAKAANIAKENLDAAITQLKNLEKEKTIAESGQNPSLAANLDGINKQIDALTEAIGDRNDQQSSAGLFGTYNELVKASAPEDPNSLGTALVTEEDYKFTITSRDYDGNQDSNSFELEDTWVINIPKSTAKEMISFPKTNQEYYLYSGAKELDQSIIPDEVSKYVYFDGDNERDQVFSNYAKERWNLIGDFVAPTFTNGGEPEAGFYNYFRNKRPKLFSSIANIMGAQVISAKTFDLSSFEDIELGSGVADINMEVTKKCDPQQRDNLLGLEDLKKKARQEYDNACDDNNDSAKSGALEKANLRNLMKAAIRLSLLDTVIRGLFVVSKFSIKKMFADEALGNVIVSIVKSDLYNQEQEYYDQFLVECKEFIDERKNNGEKFIDPFTNKEMNISTEEQSLEFIIREEMKYTTNEVEKKIIPDYKDLDMFFLDNVVPSLDVGFHKDENRFQRLLFGDLGGNELAIDSQLKSQFGFIDPNNGVYGDSGFFVLERYIRVEDNDLDLEDTNLSEAEKEFFNIWYSRAGGKNNLDADPLPSQAIDDGVNIPFEGKFGYTSGAVNIQAFLNVLGLASYLQYQAVGADEIAQIDMSKILKLFKFGLRLVYVPPSEEYGYITSTTGLFEEVQFGEAKPPEQFGDDKLKEIRDSKLALETSQFDRVYNKSLAKTKKAQDEITRQSRKEKLYTITENVATTQLTSVVELSDDEKQEQYNQVTQTRKLYPVPMVVVEEDYGVFDIIADEQGRVTIGSLQNFLNDEFKITNIYNGLKKKMVQAKEYKFLFDYDLPLKRILSMTYIHHNIAALKHYPNIKDTFVITKNLVRSNFFNMIPGDPWWSKQDKSIEQQGGNAGMMERDNNSMTPSGPTSLEIAGKIAIKAGIILTKAAAAQQDPHYSLMKKLDDFGLAPYGMTWKSVPILYPSNFPLPFPPFVGWGPPMMPIGMIAYSLPLLAGEIKQKKSRQKNKEKNNCTNDSE